MGSYGDQLIVEPVSEPLTQAEVKTHLGLPEVLQDFDAQIDGLISAARQFVEDTCNRQILSAQRKITFDAFPPVGSPMYVPRAPLQSVVSVEYYDAEKTLQTLDPSAYYVDTATQPGRLQAVDSSGWPATELRIGAVIVTIQCGDAETPANTRALMLQMVDDWFNQRSGQGEIGEAMRALLNSHKVGDVWLYGQGC